MNVFLRGELKVFENLTSQMRVTSQVYHEVDKQTNKEWWLAKHLTGQGRSALPKIEADSWKPHSLTPQQIYITSPSNQT